MIGIGITTYNRPELLEKCLSQIKAFTSNEYQLYVAKDSDENRKGVAKRKNECLFHLKECDYIFLFDDDCYPIQKGWDKFVIDAHLATGNHHFVYNKEPFCKINHIDFIGKWCLEAYDGSGAPFMFLTKKVIEEIGGFYTGYDTYGFEHIGYSMRIKKAQLTTDWFLSIRGLDEFIYSLDYEEKDFFNQKSTMPLEKKMQLTESNRIICNTEDRECYQNLDYK
jgi:glycosyltransferase involved in cell wall biosynthesis